MIMSILEWTNQNDNYTTLNVEKRLLGSKDQMQNN